MTKKITIPVLIFLFITFLHQNIECKIIKGKVVKVKDGDTVVISQVEGGHFFVCRLYGIDTPENNQQFGKEATKQLKQLIFGQQVSISIVDVDKYKRKVCLIDKDGVDINLRMIETGYAWAYKRYLKHPYASEYINSENEARKNRLGLF